MATTTTRRTRAINPLSIQLATTLSPAEHRAVLKALAILNAKMQRDGFTLSSPSAAHAHFSCLLGGLAAEAFAVAYIDSQHRVIASQILFTGTVTQTTVHPREIAKGALLHNASAVVMAHNHPSGTLQFSDADRTLTHTLKQALHVVDVRLHDHILVAGGKAISGALAALF